MMVVNQGAQKLDIFRCHRRRRRSSLLYRHGYTVPTAGSSELGGCFLGIPHGQVGEPGKTARVRGHGGGELVVGLSTLFCVETLWSVGDDLQGYLAGVHVLEALGAQLGKLFPEIVWGGGGFELGGLPAGVGGGNLGEEVFLEGDNWSGGLRSHDDDDDSNDDNWAGLENSRQKRLDLRVSLLMIYLYLP